MAPHKRAHNTLSLKEKSTIIDELKKGITGKALAFKYGVRTSTISDIKKNADKIKGFVVQCVSGPRKRKTLRKAEYPRMESELHSWFVNLRNRHVPISSELLAAKAKQLYVQCYGNDKFNASRGWVINFRKRYGIRQLKVCGKKLSADEAAKDLVKCLKNLNLKIAVCLIHNAWEKVPSETLGKCWKKVLKSNNAEEDDPEDTIPLSILRDRIHLAAEEIEEVTVMLQDIDGDAKLLEIENLEALDYDTNNYEYDSGDDVEVLETDTPIMVKHEDAIKSFNISLQWAVENDLPLSDIMMLQKLKEMAFEKHQRKIHQAKITNFFKPVLLHGTDLSDNGQGRPESVNLDVVNEKLICTVYQDSCGKFEVIILMYGQCEQKRALDLTDGPEITLDEVKRARDLVKKSKVPGSDDIPVAVIKLLNEDSIKTLNLLYSKNTT
ncbi:hypothetical protein NQ314_002866 [Rhamnusium bicolor]|uniref:HTH CENPB-type domain-containing protein n=1 Tax=Rhamnusium bicolor TaxID=1586634 RepID=A0AAV8ZNJ7_9CUCU|nr:hypothetical protein NQ314_002866 [Rhamnusium bicolor]